MYINSTSKGLHQLSFKSLVFAKKIGSPQWPIAQHEFRIRITRQIRNEDKNLTLGTVPLSSASILLPELIYHAPFFGSFLHTGTCLFIFFILIFPALFYPFYDIFAFLSAPSLYFSQIALADIRYNLVS
jgi:hypothetical protein